MRGALGGLPPEKKALLEPAPADVLEQSMAITEELLAATSTEQGWAHT
ncbi:MAG: hypothetical protein U1E15_04940 [Hyphomicrobiales bacterium]